jgi:hypothetical protein
MSCGSCEKTKAGAALAIGAPTATGAAAQTQRGQFAGDDHVCPATKSEGFDAPEQPMSAKGQWWEAMLAFARAARRSLILP